MNLIEQFGGYEKVKSIRDINIREFDGDASGVTIHYMGNSITQEDLEKALLEHRRANNIFEVGDKVVFKEKHNEVFSYSHYSDGLDLHFFESEFNYGHMDINKVRHATDAEIASGHRL